MAFNKEPEGLMCVLGGREGCPLSFIYFILNIAAVPFPLAVLNIVPFYLVFLHFFPELRCSWCLLLVPFTLLHCGVAEDQSCTVFLW